MVEGYDLRWNLGEPFLLEKQEIMYKQFFFINGAFLGEAVREDKIRDGRIGPPHGAAFFCPECSVLWAVCPIEGLPTAVWSVPCSKHYSSWLTPGSIWLDWDEAFTDAFPATVLRRELDLQLNRFIGELSEQEAGSKEIEQESRVSCSS